MIETLFETLPYYTDRDSRQAVQGCWWALLTNEFYATDVYLVVNNFKAEASKVGLAPSNAFVLVQWGSILLQYCARNSVVWDQWGLDLVFSEAQVLELCLSSKASPNLKKSALVATRRALLRLFDKTSSAGNDAVETVVSRLTEKAQRLGLRSAVILGVVAGVCARLPTTTAILDSCKSQYYSFYVREIVGSRSTVPQHIATAFTDLFSNFTSFEDLHIALIPTFEKALLRAPEVVLGLLLPLVASLPSEIDLAQVLAEQLLKPLLSNIKSQSLVIRNGAMSAFSVLIGRSHDENYIERVLNDILTPISTSKLATAEQRMLHARMLSQIPPVSSQSLLYCEKLARIAAKEPHEMAVGAEASALTHFFSYLILSDLEYSSGEISSIIDTYLKGLSDKRPGIRKAWAMRSGDLLWLLTAQPTNPLIVQFVEATVPKILEIFDEMVINPQSAGSSGSFVIAYVIASLSRFMLDTVQDEKLESLILKAKIHDRAVSSTSKSSLLLNHRLYTRLSDYTDYIWLIRALEVCSGSLVATEALMTSDAWVQAFLFLITAAEVPFTVRKQAMTAMSNLYLTKPNLIGNILVRGLWNWYQNVINEEKDTAAAAARTGNTNLYLALRCICPLSTGGLRSKSSNPGSDLMQNQLINMLVLCRPEILPNVNWIEVCLRVGQDPGVLVQSNSVQCLEKIESCRNLSGLGSASSLVELAANNAAADLVFVAPANIVPLLLEKIESDLLPESVRNFGPNEIAISQTPEGSVFVDVLNTEKRGITVDKSSRDYDTMKWEEEVRSQVAQRKGQERKLTPDQKARVDAQLAKEAAIRQDVRRLQSKLKRGIGLIHALATGPPTDPGVWLGKSLKALLDIITAGAGHIVGGAADEAYLACARVVSSRLGSLRQFIGVATLRASGFSTLPANLEQEPLGSEGPYPRLNQ